MALEAVDRLNLAAKQRNLLGKIAQTAPRLPREFSEFGFSNALAFLQCLTRFYGLDLVDRLRQGDFIVYTPWGDESSFWFRNTFRPEDPTPRRSIVDAQSIVEDSGQAGEGSTLWLISPRPFAGVTCDGLGACSGVKAAVLHSFQTPPLFEDFPKPTAAPGEVLLEMRASPLTPIAKSAAAGLHVSAPREFPAVVGLEGVGTLPDGTRVYTNDFHWPQGGMAEYAITRREHCIPVPDSLSDEMAAALPNPGLSSWLALVHRAQMRRGESVLVLGATGLSGKLAIPIAKHLGAGHLVAAGRNEQVLRTLPDLGADATVSLLQPEAALAESLVKAGTRGRFDIVLDYLWGRTAELVLLLLRGHGQPNPGLPTRFVCLGSAAGPTATLTSAAFRNSNIELLGSGAGNLPPDAARRVLPDLWSLAEKVRLPIEIERVPLSDVTHAWGLPDRSGLRRVVVP